MRTAFLLIPVWFALCAVTGLAWHFYRRDAKRLDAREDATDRRANWLRSFSFDPVEAADLVAHEDAE